MRKIEIDNSGTYAGRKYNRFLRWTRYRLFVTALLILLQILWIVLFFTGMKTAIPWIGPALELMSIVVTFSIVNRDDNPAYKIGWMLIVMIVPLFGVLMYAAFSNKRPAKKLANRMKSGQRAVDTMMPEQNAAHDALNVADARACATARYVLLRAGYPVFTGTKTTYYEVGEHMFEDIKKALWAAEKYIFLEYYIIGLGVMWDEILDILQHKKREGVDVRVCYDDMGSINVLPKHYDETLRKMGIPCVKFNPIKPIVAPVMNNRNHRKILVIDGKVAFTGGVNLSDEYINKALRFGHWKDTGVKLEGPGAFSFLVMFLQMWGALTKQKEDLSRYVVSEPVKTAKGFVQPFSDTPFDRESVSINIYLDLIAQARECCYVFTPYLVPDEATKDALILAAKRGVDVRIVTPGIPDKKFIYRITRSNYAPLLRAGVTIYEYTPGFLHAKNMLIDDRLAVVGTVNLDYRSLFLHFECGAILYETSCIQAIKQDFLNTFSKSRRVTLEDREKNALLRLCDWLLRLFSPLL